MCSSDLNIREADWKVNGKQLSNIRRLDFIVEQQVPEQEEWDGQDEDSWHWIATDNQDLPIGTARLLPDGQIGRMAVLNEHRKFGVGAALLEQAVEKPAIWELIPSISMHRAMPWVFMKGADSLKKVRSLSKRAYPTSA